MDDDESWTAYHECGHAVIAYALGGSVDSIGLGGEADDWLPDRFGDCRILWGPIDAHTSWQRQREVLAILAGPVAEMVYRDQPLRSVHGNLWHYGPWQQDWRIAVAILRQMVGDPRKCETLLEQLIGQLHHRIQQPPCWPAIAALADELLAHQWLDADQIDATIGFWFRSG